MQPGTSTEVPMRHANTLAGPRYQASASRPTMFACRNRIGFGELKGVRERLDGEGLIGFMPDVYPPWHYKSTETVPYDQNGATLVPKRHRKVGTIL